MSPGGCMGTCNKSTCSERICTDPPILGHLQLPVAASHLQQPPAASTSSNINHLQLFYNLQRPLAAISTTCSFFYNLQRPLAAISTIFSFFTTCSGHLQQYQPLAATTYSDYLQRPLAATTCSAKFTSKNA